MKNPGRLCVFVALILCACSSPKLAERKLPSGDSIGVIAVTAIHFNNGPPALMLKYQTSKPIQDTVALRKQADEIWLSFRPQVEQGGFKNAILSANDPPQGFIFTHNSTYNFVFDQKADGSWHCSFDDKKPADK
jgi:hypothetical protein